jgi:hypothetical protein
MRRVAGRAAAASVAVLAATTVVALSHALSAPRHASPVPQLVAPDDTLDPAQAGLPVADVASDGEETIRLTRLLKLQPDDPAGGVAGAPAVHLAGGLVLVPNRVMRLPATFTRGGAAPRAPPVDRVYGR